MSVVRFRPGPPRNTKTTLGWFFHFGICYIVAMKPLIKFIFISLLFMCLSAGAEIVNVPYQNGDPTRTWLNSVDAPKALVILLMGGDGKAGIFDNGSARSNHTFVRSQGLWAQYGIDSVLVDSFDDLSIRGGGRLTDDYQNRLLSIATYYKNKFHAPVWLFGHSNGTVSVTEFVNRFGDRNVISGFIVAGTEQTAILKDTTKLPVLAVHHVQDTCRTTPISASESLIKSRPPGTRAEFITMDGGISTGNVCWALAYHGFNQKEDDLIKDAAAFILKK